LGLLLLLLLLDLVAPLLHLKESTAYGIQRSSLITLSGLLYGRQVLQERGMVRI
jgi:hypothetical protein